MSEKIKSFEKPQGKSHLDKDFLEELKHKLWSTRGSRLRASERLKIQEKYSILSLSFLSAYLIIFGLLSVYNLFNENKISENIIPFSITSISIFLLVFSLFENSKNYAIRSLQYHNCALEISRLYNKLQTYKSYDKDATHDELKKFTLDLQDKYQTVLEKYENHLQIDNIIFKLDHRDYYTEIKWYHALMYRFKNILITYFWYYLAIIAPGLILTIIMIKTI